MPKKPSAVADRPRESVTSPSLPEDQPFDGLPGADFGQHAQRYAVVDVDEIKPHPRNPNKGDVELIAKSIETNTWYGACTVQESTGYILAGEHRWRAARQLGVLQIPVIYKDVDDRTAIRIMLADNETAKHANTDDAAINELLAELAPVDDAGLRDAGALVGTGFSLATLEAYESDREAEQALKDAEAEKRARIGAPRPTNEDGSLALDPDLIPDDSQVGLQYGLLIVCDTEEDQQAMFLSIKLANPNATIRPVSV